MTKEKKIIKNNIWMYVSFLLVIVLLLLVFNSNQTISKNIDQSSNLEENTTDPKIIDNMTYTLGEKEAPVKIIEYSSFTCPFCKRYKIDDKTFENIKTEYIDTGKVVYEYRHFTRNQTDVLAANAAECAREQDKFYEYINILYQEQTNLQEQNFENYAKDLKLDTSQFNSCFSEKRYNDKIEKDKQEAIANGITGTPGFLINETKVSGAQPFSVFKNVIDSFI